LLFCVGTFTSVYLRNVEAQNLWDPDPDSEHCCSLKLCEVLILNFNTKRLVE